MQQSRTYSYVCQHDFHAPESVARRVLWAHLGRGDDTVGNPHRGQIRQFELFELILLLKFDKQFPAEQFEATVSQSTVPSPPLNTCKHFRNRDFPWIRHNRIHRRARRREASQVMRTGVWRCVCLRLPGNPGTCCYWLFRYCSVLLCLMICLHVSHEGVPSRSPAHVSTGFSEAICGAATTAFSIIGIIISYITSSSTMIKCLLL